MKTSGFLLLCTAVAAAGFVIGRWHRTPAANGPRSTPPAAAALSPLAAPTSTWPSQWQNARPAERDVLLQSWIARDPRVALQFLLKLPPGSFSGQRLLEKEALFAWSRREPSAAYTFAATHDCINIADDLLDETFTCDSEAALEMLRSRVHRHGGRGCTLDFAWIVKDPARACAALSTLPRGFKQDDLMNSAFRAWAQNDAQSAIAFALKLNEDRSREAITGILAGLPPEEAARLTLKLKEPAQMKAAARRLMKDWGSHDPAAATAWAIENLPPGGLAQAMACFDSDIAWWIQDAFENKSRADVLAAFTPAAWLALAGQSLNKPEIYLEAAPAWMRPKLYAKLSGSISDLAKWSEPQRAPQWFQKLPAELAGEFVQSMAQRQSSRESWPSLSSIPPQWQDAAARGILESMIVSRGAEEEKVQALPPVEKALLRAQLPNMDQSLPALKRISELLRD